MAPSDEHAYPLAPVPSPMIQTDLPSSLPLAPFREVPTDREESRAGRGFWMILVAILAFLLASSAARNSDVWMHLARGRSLAHGQFALGLADPIASGVPANPSWLYDLMGYVLYSTTGETGLVLTKAFVVVALALCLFRLTRTGSEQWLGACCAALAILTTGERLLLQPVALSYLFLALAILFVSSDIASEGRDRPRSPLRLFVLFVLWVNVDRWFVLGLGVVALVWLGQVLDRASGRDGGDGDWWKLLRARGGVWALLSAACLLNPRFAGAFALPAELASAGLPGMSPNGLLYEQVTSPFERAYLAGRALTPAGLAYYALLALSLLSFVGNSAHWSWQRFLPWLGLTLLSILQVRTVPFFAIVAGPVLAWNARDFLIRRLQADSAQKNAWRRASWICRALAVPLLLLLPVLAWPGWLQSPPFEPRRWNIDTPPSLVDGAVAVGEWVKPKQGDSQPLTLHLSPESVYAFAWFCPQVRSVRDPDLTLALQNDRTSDPDTLARLRSLGIDRVIVYDANRARFLATMGALFHESRQWSLLHLEGYLAVFAWHDPAHPSSKPTESRGLNLDRLAFHPDLDARAPGEASVREPEARLWWEAFWKPVPRRLLEQEEATLHLRRADVLARSAPERHQLLWDNCQVAALLGSASGWRDFTSLVEARQRLALVDPLVPSADREYASLPVIDRLSHAWKMRFFHAQDDTSPVSLYLAIRAARRALSINPEAAQAYLVLGECYLRLLQNTRERLWSEQWTELGHLRRCQACTALNRAVLLKPDYSAAHLDLYLLYRDMGFLDLSLKHLRAYADLAQKAGPDPGESVSRYLERVASLREGVSRTAKAIETREYGFLVASAGWNVADRAAKASREGLASKALELLLESDISAFGKQGMSLELELLLKTGQAQKVLDWTGPEQQATLRGVYHLLRIQAEASLGNYERARAECGDMSDSMTRMPSGPTSMGLREIMAEIIGERILNDPSDAKNVCDLIVRAGQRHTFHERLQEFSFALRKEADTIVLRGLLALEQGDGDEAEVAFRQALSLWKNETAVARGEGLDFDSRRVAQQYLSWLESSRVEESNRP